MKTPARNNLFVNKEMEETNRPYLAGQLEIVRLSLKPILLWMTQVFVKYVSCVFLSADAHYLETYSHFQHCERI